MLLPIISLMLSLPIDVIHVETVDLTTHEKREYKTGASQMQIILPEHLRTLWQCSVERLVKSELNTLVLSCDMLGPDGLPVASASAYSDPHGPASLSVTRYDWSRDANGKATTVVSRPVMIQAY